MKTVIFLGGEAPPTDIARRESADAGFIIAADSGYVIAEAAGVEPDVLVGDFDSFPNPSVHGRTRIIPAPEQDATDFQKALRFLPSDCSRVVILGGTGLRSDHFLTNLLIAASLPPELPVVFLDPAQEIHRVTPARTLHLVLRPDSTISLIPFSNCRNVHSSGLHWNLNGEDMGPGGQLGQSNRADLPEVSISIGDGLLFTVVNLP